LPAIKSAVALNSGFPLPSSFATAIGINLAILYNGFEEDPFVRQTIHCHETGRSPAILFVPGDATPAGVPPDSILSTELFGIA